MGKDNFTKPGKNPDYGKGKGNFFFDFEEGTLMGRTPGSWFLITVFYIVFYALLAGFAYICYIVFETTIVDDQPKWKMTSGLIGSNPGVGYRPMPNQDENAGSSLIWYRSNLDRDAKAWYNQLRDYVKNADLPPKTSAVVNCDYNGTHATEKNACRVDLTNLGRCNLNNKFGYLEAKPCVLIKLNRIYGWEPEPFGINEDGEYDQEQLQVELDDMTQQINGMPISLKNYILSKVNSNPGQEAEILRTVWISCKGENVGDQENLPEGNIAYFPQQGIPGYFFPYLKQRNYRSPFVMVAIDLPPASKHVLINIECRAWANNIEYVRQTRLGSTHFEIMID